MKRASTGSRKEQILKDLTFNYDELNDLLYVHKKNSNVYSNIEVGDFHLEFDKKKQIIGLEILNASELLEEYGISKEFMKKADKAYLKVVVNNNSMIIFLIMHSLNKEKSAAITMSDIESPMMQAISSA